MGEADPTVETGAPDTAEAPGGADPIGSTDADPSRLSPLMAWAFAAFHAALLVAVVVAALFFAGVAGNQLAALDTSVGVVAYLYLWGVTWWTNRRLIDAVGQDLVAGSASPSGVFVEAMKWGAVVGLLVFLPALVVGTVFFVGAGGLEAVPFLLVAAAVGTAVSAGVGVIVGGAFALLDLLLVGLARAWLPAGDPTTSPSDS